MVIILSWAIYYFLSIFVWKKNNTYVERIITNGFFFQQNAFVFVFVLNIYGFDYTRSEGTVSIYIASRCLSWRAQCTLAFLIPAVKVTRLQSIIYLYRNNLKIPLNFLNNSLASIYFFCLLYIIYIMHDICTK